MGKASRDKGKRGERDVAKILREHGYADARRGVQYHGGGDSPDVVGLPGIHIEVKRVESLRLYDALDQSEHDAAAGEIPVVFHRRDKKPWVAILRLDDFLELLRKDET